MIYKLFKHCLSLLRLLKKYIESTLCYKSLWLFNAKAFVCLGCEEYHFLHEGLCVPSCPDGFFEDDQQGECMRCHADCALCDGPNSDDCDACIDPEATLHNGACLAPCPSHTYRDTMTGECEGRTNCTVKNMQWKFTSLFKLYEKCWV